MTVEREQRVKELLAQLLHTSAKERAGVLELVCAEDVELRSEVESLARAYDEGGDFLATDHPPPVEVTAPEPAGTHIGRYIILEKIGEGGFGTVFLAEQMHPVRRTVALKLLKAGMDTKQVIGRFSAERQALAMMDHPNVAKVLDAGSTDSGRPYFVMDLIRGTPITRYCDEHKLTIRQRLELFLQVCQGVQHAHTKGIIHRDLKPSNVLVTESDGAAIPKVIDFGIAKATTGPLTDQTMLTELRQLLGTPQYMSPEQADGSADIDTRSDVYSLGVILYELLSGSTPFDFKTSGFAEVHRVIREVEPPPPSARVAQRELKGDLDRIVLKAMEKDRVRRYETASALGSDIRRYLNHEPVTARHAGRIYRFRKLVRRNKLPFAAAASVVLALVMGLMASSWFLTRALKADAEQRRLRVDAEATAYTSDINAVQQAQAVNNYARARQLLDRHRPSPGERDLRGWEWRYLWQQCRSDARAQLFRRPVEAGEISSLAVSHDGRWVATGDFLGGGLSIWDLVDRRYVEHLQAGDEHVRLAFSPKEPLLAYVSLSRNADGRERARLHLWDGRTRRTHTSVPLDSWCVGLAFSRDGRRLVTSTNGDRGRVTVWAIPDLTKLSDLPVSQFAIGYSHPFSATPDLDAVAVTAGSEIRTVCPTTTWKWANQTFKDAILSTAFSPDGRVFALAGGSSPTSIELHGAAAGTRLGPALTGHRGAIFALLFWPDGKTLASASADQTIRLWDVSDPLHPHPIGRPLRGGSEFKQLALMPDLKTLVSGSKDGTVCLWNSDDVRTDLSYLSLDAVAGWSFDSDGTSLMTLDLSGLVIRYEGPDHHESKILQALEPVDAGDFLAGRLLLSRSGRNFSLRDLQTKKVIREEPVPFGGIKYSGFTPEGHWIAYSESDNTLREWDLPHGMRLPLQHPPGVVTAVPFSRDRRWMAVVCRNGRGTLIELTVDRRTPLELGTMGIGGASFSPDGTLLAVGSGAGFARVWKTNDLVRLGKEAKPITFPQLLTAAIAVDFSPDSKRLAVSSIGSEAVTLYTVDSRQQLLTLAATDSRFERIEFSPDGTLLAASNDRGELHVWRAPTLQEIDSIEATEPRHIK